MEIKLYENVSEHQTHLWPNNDVVDRYVDELHKEANEAHDAETNRCGDRYLLEFWKRNRYHNISWAKKLSYFAKLNQQYGTSAAKNVSTFSVGLRAPFHQPDGVLSELAAGLDEFSNLIHFPLEILKKQEPNITSQPLTPGYIPSNRKRNHNFLLLRTWILAPESWNWGFR